MKLSQVKALLPTLENVSFKLGKRLFRSRTFSRYRSRNGYKKLH